MANKFRGEKQFEAGGKVYTLVYDTNAICALEQELGRSFLEMSRSIGETKAPKFIEARAMLWAGMLRHHPSTTLTRCGDIMDEPEIGFMKVFDLCMEALRHCFPQPKDPGVEKNETAAVGTGGNSSLPPVQSD